MPGTIGNSSTAFSANRNTNWYIGSDKKHTGTTFSVGASGDWTPSDPNLYAITGKDSTDETITDSAQVLVAKCQAISVDASTPATTKINYKLSPSSLTCSATFKLGNGTETTKDVSGDFYFTFNQSEIVSDKTLLLKISNSDLPEKQDNQTLAVAFTSKNEDKSLTEYVVVEGMGLRVFPWGAVNNYRRYDYSVSATGKLLKFQSSTSRYPAEAFISLATYPTEASDYTIAFTNKLTGGTDQYLTIDMSSLAPFTISRGLDFSQETEKPITSYFTVNVGYNTNDGPAIVSSIINSTITLTLN